jgi:hypothetical protein
MRMCFALLALLFFVLSFYDGFEVRGYLKEQGSLSAVDSLPTNLAGPEAIPQALLRLEAQAMDHRYRQASALLMSRIWTRQLAFVTGMVLALIGAVFILGKLSEGPTDVSLGGREWRGAIASSSPGLLLAFFGVVLIGISLAVQPKIEVQDRPVYFAPMALMPRPNTPPTTRNTDTGALDPGLDQSGPTQPKPQPSDTTR